MAPGGPLPAACAVLLAIAVSGCQMAPSAPDAETDAVAAVEPEPMTGVLPPSDITPDQLTGLDLGDLIARLGPADFDRRDGPAQILQYRNGTCTLDVFLYRDTPDDTFRVAHVEARDPDMRGVSDESCLRTVRETRRDKAGRS